MPLAVCCRSYHRTSSMDGAKTVTLFPKFHLLFASGLEAATLSDWQSPYPLLEFYEHLVNKTLSSNRILIAYIWALGIYREREARHLTVTLGLGTTEWHSGYELRWTRRSTSASLRRLLQPIARVRRNEMNSHNKPAYCRRQLVTQAGVPEWPKPFPG